MTILCHNMPASIAAQRAANLGVITEVLDSGMFRHTPALECFGEEAYRGTRHAVCKDNGAEPIFPELTTDNIDHAVKAMKEFSPAGIAA